MSDTSITVIYHAMSLTVLYVYHSDLSRYVSDCTVCTHTMYMYCLLTLLSILCI